MALDIGTRLGAYEIIGELGAGGMGEVYRATDTKLGREVAIKTLPSALAKDTDRLARFEREAKLLAALNHAHIAAIYGLDEHEGTQYLAMELVEGETLEEKLKAGPLPVEDALHLALQIAEALEAAHEKGVVHRDLKPANIMLTAEGQVKVLDFGLAKAFSGDPDEASPAHSPALSIAMTQQGLILGTAGYMSPEQASGQATDQRADIWAFGVVLYEMLTGLPLFSGESVPHILADVLRAEPDWNRLPKNLHPRLKLLLERCLEKKVRNRYHSIADVRVDIEKVLSDPQGVTSAVVIAPPTSRRALPLVAATVVVTGVIATLLAWILRPEASHSIGLQRVSVMTPANRPVAITGWPTRSLAISPDGRRLVYIGANLDAPAGSPRIQLELRYLANLAVRDLPGITTAYQPFFSPDGQWVAFFTSSGELKKVSLAGGSPITLAEKINGSQWAFGVWTKDDTIVFGSVAPGHGLRRVSAEGGKVTDVTTLDAARHEAFHWFPALVPGGRVVLFTVVSNDSSSPPEINAVMLDSGKRRMVLGNAGMPLLVDGGRFLLFQREQSILIAPFDTKRLSVTGPAVPLTDKVRRDRLGTNLPVAQVAVSQSGTLAYLPATDTAAELGLVSRDGSFKKLGLPLGDYGLPRVSPDGHAVAFIEAHGQKATVRIYDLQRGTTTNLGMDEDDTGLAWRPGSQSLAVSSFSKGLVLESLDGTKRPLVPAPTGDRLLRAGSWSPDGKHFSYVVQKGSRHDIWVLTMGEKADEKPSAVPFINSAAEEYNPQFSPDGRWLAFVSNESGRFEVYAQRYPKGERLAVSTNGGTAPVWSPDGKELLFLGPDGGVPKLMAVSVIQEGDRLQLGKPVGLFELRGPGPSGAIMQYTRGGNAGVGYDVAPDGKQFVMVRRNAAAAREIVLVQNWSQELERAGATK